MDSGCRCVVNRVIAPCLVLQVAPKIRVACLWITMSIAEILGQNEHRKPMHPVSKASSRLQNYLGVHDI